MGKKILVLDCHRDKEDYGARNIVAALLRVESSVPDVLRPADWSDSRRPDFSKEWPSTVEWTKRIPDLSWDFVFISGSAESMFSDASWVHAVMDCVQAWKTKALILGVCFGSQIIGRSQGAQGVQHPCKNEPCLIYPNKNTFCKLWEPQTKSFWSERFHQESLVVLPEGFEVTASSDTTGIEGFQASTLGLYGLQFHIEKPASDQNACDGIFRNFLKI
jgi:GMP synthase-like glutamine amidotransferase